MAEDGKVDVVRLGEVTAVYRPPRFVVEVTERAREALDAVARLPVAEASKELEGVERKGEGRADGGIGEHAVLDEADVVRAACLGYHKAVVSS